MLKGFGITLGAALLASLVIQDSKETINVIAPSIPCVDAEQSTADKTGVGPYLGSLYLHLPTNAAGAVQKAISSSNNHLLKPVCTVPKAILTF